MHIIERLHLVKPNLLDDDVEIYAPKVLAKVWKTTRIFHRYPDRPYEIIEGQCVQEDLVEAKDAAGNAIFIHQPRQTDDGAINPAQHR
jgi:hypothetical protein